MPKRPMKSSGMEPSGFRIVLEDHLLAGVQGDDDAAAGPGGLFFSPQGDGVDAVLEQLPEEDIGAFVEVVGEDIQHTAQVHLEAEGFGGRHGAVLLSL